MKKTAEKIGRVSSGPVFHCIDSKIHFYICKLTSFSSASGTPVSCLVGKCFFFFMKRIIFIIILDLISFVFLLHNKHLQIIFYELHHEKIYVQIINQVRLKPACTAKESSCRLENCAAHCLDSVVDKTYYIQNFKFLVIVTCGRAGRFLADLVANS